MDGRLGRPASKGAGIDHFFHVGSRLVGRGGALRVFDEVLAAADGGRFQFVGVAGEPGSGKTRLLVELAEAAARLDLVCSLGRAAEFEQEMPFAVVVDALDGCLEGLRPGFLERMDAASTRLLTSVFPSLATALPREPESEPDLTGLGRYRLYRTVRQLLDELAEPAGLVLVLDDVHWADDTSLELLDHLVRHPPRGRVLIAVAYRPAQAPLRLTALANERGRQVDVGPLSEAEVAEFLGPQVERERRQVLYEASGGNPFYLEALARPAESGGLAESGEFDEAVTDDSGLSPAIQATLQVELGGLSASAMLVAQGAAVSADEFEPALAAVAAGVSDDTALTALDELVARDVVRPETMTRRFCFRHPLVRSAVYNSAAAGWRLSAHARLADYLHRVGAPAVIQAHHVYRSGTFGDETAISILTTAARSVASSAPATAAHWLNGALRLMPVGHDARLAVLTELAAAQAVTGIIEGRENAREALRRLPDDDHVRRARAARICAMVEGRLGQPDQGRAVLLEELRKIPDQRSVVALGLRLRLVADNLIRSDYQGAQALLDSVPDDAPEWGRDIPLAIAAMRPLPALATRRVDDAVRHIEQAGALLEAAADEHVAEWSDMVAWLCWTEAFIGRFKSARGHFDRVIGIARSTGQSNILPNLLAGQARTLTALGELARAAAAAQEAADMARELSSSQHLVFALIQQCLAASWSGDAIAALGFADKAIEVGVGRGEWWGSMPRYFRALALINGDRPDEGAVDLLAAFDGREESQLDPATMQSGCETMANLEMARGREPEAMMWADRAHGYTHPGMPTSIAYADLARAHTLDGSDPIAAAEHAGRAAEVFTEAGMRLDAARARFRAGIALAKTGQRADARQQLREAAKAFDDCGADTLHAQAVREQRRLGVRVPASDPRGRGTGPYGLTRREYEVANLVSNGYTNKQIADELFLSTRTIETHLSHIFTKLSVTSRVGLINTLKQSEIGHTNGRARDTTEGKR